VGDPRVTLGEYLKIKKTKNPLDRDVRIKRAHGFSDAILENAEKVLRLPGKRQVERKAHARRTEKSKEGGASILETMSGYLAEGLRVSKRVK